MNSKNRALFLLFLITLGIGYILHSSRTQAPVPPVINPKFESSLAGEESKINRIALQSLDGKDGETKVVASLRLRSLTIGDEGHGQIKFATSGENSPGLWITAPNNRSIFSAGVHDNGSPFLLVGDNQVRNFGLGRVDGKQAGPILVFRSDDVVRLVFGLDMTDRDKEPFFVYYPSDEKKQFLFGTYCDRKDRVCVN